MTTTRGLTYPLKMVAGGLQVSEDIVLLKESILSVLQTRPFERVMRPTYGTPDLVFTAVPSISVVTEQIRQALTLHIPEVQSFQVSGAMNDDGVAQVRVDWSVDGIPQPPVQFKLLG